jgi:hypothetical protein
MAAAASAARVASGSKPTRSATTVRSVRPPTARGAAPAVANARAFDDEERIATRQLVKLRDLEGRERATGDARRHRGDLALGEGREVDRRRVATDADEALARSLAEARIGRARRRDDRDAQRRDRRGEEREQVQSLQIGGVEIFDRPEQRFAGGGLGGQAREHLLPQAKGIRARGRRLEAERAEAAPEREIGRGLAELP